MKRNELLVTREWMVRASQVAGAVVDDESQPDELRAGAADVEFMLSEVLLYQDHSADGTRSIRMLPILFGWPQGVTSMLDEFLLDVGADVVAEHPAQVLMARLAAKYCDDGLFSSDFRLDAYDALNQILAALTRAAQDEEAAEEVQP